MPYWKSKAALCLALLSSAIVLGSDRLLRTASYQCCHTETTKMLPLFSSSPRDGLVRIKAGGMQFRARVAGLANAGEAVILLHGFPHTSIMWQDLMVRLAHLGFRVLAFDQRGYSPLARPDSVADYGVEKLVGDVIAVADAVGFERFHLVGHDWGAAVGWVTAARYPDRVATLTALSMPHPNAFGDALKHGEQLARSGYILFRQMPWVPELVLSFNRFTLLRHAQWAHATASQRREYMAVFGEPGAMSAALNWYRAAGTLVTGTVDKTKSPTLYLWGNADEAFGRMGAENTAEHVEGPYRFVEMNAGHSLTIEAPKAVSREILSHIAG